MFVLLEPTEAAYNVLDDDALLFEAAKAVVAQKLVREAEEAAPLVDKPAYLKERRDAEKNISDRLRAAYGRLLLWKSPPVSYDESELDPIGLKGNHFTYDAALAELKGFALDRDTHRRDVLNHLDQFRSLTVPIIEQTFRATLGLHIPVPKDIIGDTLIQMAKDYEISLVHPSHTYCGPEDYSKLTGNQRLELGRCTLAEPLPERAPPTIAPPQPVIPPVTPSPGPTMVPPIAGPGTPFAPPPIANPLAAVVPENIGPTTRAELPAAVKARLPDSASVDYIEVSIEIQDSLQPAQAAAWSSFAGAVDKPTEIDLAIKLTRHVASTPAEVDEWLAALPDVPHADYRVFMKVRQPAPVGV